MPKLGKSPFDDASQVVGDLPVLEGNIQLSNRGTFVANGVTPVVIAYPDVTRNLVIVFTLNTVGGTVGAIPSIKTITPGTGFTVAATASDTSTYNWAVVAELV